MPSRENSIVLPLVEGSKVSPPFVREKLNSNLGFEQPKNFFSLKSLHFEGWKIEIVGHPTKFGKNKKKRNSTRWKFRSRKIPRFNDRGGFERPVRVSSWKKVTAPGKWRTPPPFGASDTVRFCELGGNLFPSRVNCQSVTRAFRKKKKRRKKGEKKSSGTS